MADRIEAVLWFSDLRNYTRISDTSPPEAIIPLLNDYADAIVSAIHQNSGDVLKLIGDGVLAIFPAEERGRACAAALDAAKLAREAVAVLNARRLAEGAPATDMYLGLHIGEVFYGNIGSKERLDFTVVGPAVNEVSRIAAMCRSVDQPVLLSAAFAASIAGGRGPFVSVGRYALRGVGKPQELYHARQPVVSGDTVLRVRPGGRSDTSAGMSPSSPPAILTVERLAKSFGTVKAVDGVSFHVSPGEIVGLLGPNGAGKTTTINMILGVLEPTAGRIAIGGVDLRADRSAALASTNFAAVYAPLPGNLTVEQNLRVFGMIYAGREFDPADRAASRRLRPDAVPAGPRRGFCRPASRPGSASPRRC